MRFIHAADIHLGAEPEKGRPFSKMRTKEIRNTFKRLLKEAEELEVDFLFISGDLFHRQPLIQDLRELDYLLGRMQGVTTVIIAGNHDHVTEDSPYRTYEFSSDTYVLYEPEMTELYFEDVDTHVYGLSYWSQEMTEACYDDCEPLGEDGFHILLAHGGDVRHAPMDYEKLKWSGFDYIALGHIHKPQIIYEDLMAYPGSLEPLDVTEQGDHGYLLGEITEEKQIVTFEPFACRSYQRAEVIIYDTMSAEEIYDTIRVQLERMGPDNMFQLVLMGSIDPAITLDLTEIEDEYYIVSIEEQMTAYGNFEEMYENNRDNLIGAVMLKLKDRPEALSYAMKALLTTADS